MDENNIIPYIEPIYRFCCKRLNNRYDAEDLSSEIICHILDGLQKYKIESLDAWVWRIAHNRYAKFIDAKNKNLTVLTCNDTLFDIADYSDVDTESAEREYEAVFRYLHTLSSEYRNIFVDYYIGEMSVKGLAEKYSLPETTVKWRLNVGRQKIRKRIGEFEMDKVYKRINWNTTCCNGHANTHVYLGTQIARAICKAAYEKPLTIEEISFTTGIPAMYIEDELTRLEYGDAVCKFGNKYAANFIVFSLQDRKSTENVSASLVTKVADELENIFKINADTVQQLEFYGNDFGMDRLGYILVPYILRRKLRTIKNTRLNLPNGNHPPRRDGGYGWFIVEETVDENEKSNEYNAGCNVAGDDSGSRYEVESHIYYYWIAKYFSYNVYHNGGTRWMCANGIPQRNSRGIINKELLSDDDAVRLIQNNLIVKSGDCYNLNFACFTADEFRKFAVLFNMNDEKLDDLLAEWILTVRKNFEKFVPKRLDDQINQWVSTYMNQLTGYVVEELISRGVLKRPDAEKPLTDCVFYVGGEYIDP